MLKEFNETNDNLDKLNSETNRLYARIDRREQNVIDDFNNFYYTKFKNFDPESEKDDSD